MRAACIRADAAALSDASSCWDMRCRIARNSPPPKSARMDRKTPTYHAVSRSRRRASECISAGSRPEAIRSEEHTSELQSHSDLVCRLQLEKKKQLTLI